MEEIPHETADVTPAHAQWLPSLLEHRGTLLRALGLFGVLALALGAKDHGPTLSTNRPAALKPAPAGGDAIGNAQELADEPRRDTIERVEADTEQITERERQRQEYVAMMRESAGLIADLQKQMEADNRAGVCEALQKMLEFYDRVMAHPHFKQLPEATQEDFHKLHDLIETDLAAIAKNSII